MSRGGGFVPGPLLTMSASAVGPLSGLRFAAKDLFDVRGHVTGAGNPDWLRTHAAASQTAVVLDRLLGGGACLTGKTVTDELAYSLIGDNMHYGAPANPATPERLTGGSSSGSASVVAEGSVDFALGTDTAGSIRVPASNCALFGFRPTHGALSAEGIIPLAPSFDAPGWVARDAETFVKVGRALVDDATGICDSTRADVLPISSRVAIVRRAFDHVDAACRAVVWNAAQALAVRLRMCCLAPLESDLPLADISDSFRIVQAYEAWRAHGEWISTQRPIISSDITARFNWGAELQASSVVTARAELARHRRWIDSLFGVADILVWPTAADRAPLRVSSLAERDIYRRSTLQLTSVASMAGLPEVTLPVCRVDGVPMGVSLIAPRGHDVRLLELVARLHSIAPRTSA
jgi:amidase